MAPMVEPPAPQVQDLGFSISHQKVDLEIDLLSRSLKGRTEITLNPHSKDLRRIRLHCRQCDVKYLSVNSRPAQEVRYEDCYKRARLPYKAGVRQYHLLEQRIDKAMKSKPEEELVFTLPSKLKIDEIDPSSEDAQSLLLLRTLGSTKRVSDASATELAQGPRIGADLSLRFVPINIYIEFVIPRIRDGMQFVGLGNDDLRYPHAYTTNSGTAGTACCLFPCLDDLTARCTWEVTIKTAKTLGDLFSPQVPVNGVLNGASRSPNARLKSNAIEDLEAFSNEDKAIELTVVCSGDMTDEVGMNSGTCCILAADYSQIACGFWRSVKENYFIHVL